MVSLTVLVVSTAFASVGAPATSQFPTWPRSISAAATPTGRTILYAALVDGVSASRDGGRTWRRGLGFGKMNIWLGQVAASRGASAIAYAAGWTGPDWNSARGEVFVSRDGGRHWRATRLGRDKVVDHLVVDPSNPAIVYAGTDDALYRTTNGGDSWRRLALPAGYVTGVAIEPGRPDHLYVVVEGHGLFRSTNRGATWRGAMASSRYGGEISAIAFDQLSPGVLYAATGIGIYRGGSGGTWRHVYGGRRGDDGHIHALAFDGRNAGTAYAVTYCEGIIKSRNSGRTWRAINRGFVPGCRPPYDVEIDPRNSNVLYALTPDVGLFKSTNGGRSWGRTLQP